jgi:hypothetical protein
MATLLTTELLTTFKKTQTNMSINKNQAIIICIVGAIAMIAFANYTEQTKTSLNKPAITAEASFEDLRSEKQKELDQIKSDKEDLDKKAEITKKKLEILDLEESLKADQPVQAIEEKKELVAPVKTIIETVANIIKQDDPTELPKSGWTPFVDFAKQNLWRGKTFPEGNHLEIAKKNQSKYENIQGCHPFLLMAIHYTETGLQFNNGANGQGAFQAYSRGIRYEPNSPTTDFDVQAKRACDHIRGKVGGADLSDIEDANLIGKALALYNGCYSPALGIYARGDFGSPDGWDKCPYAANFLQSNDPMTQCATDGCRTTNKRQIYGTMAFIAHLKIK